MTSVFKGQVVEREHETNAARLAYMRDRDPA
jgi:hypothetical protein